MHERPRSRGPTSVPKLPDQDDFASMSATLPVR